MYNCEVKKVTSATKTDLYTIRGNEADMTSATLVLKDKMASGSTWITTDSGTQVKTYHWDELTQAWGQN